MAISDDVFKAILSMDSYNRGYDRKMNVSGDAIGTATLVQNTINDLWEDASFFAQAYDWNGTTIISYRGTDDSNFFDPNADPRTGYDLALGGVWDQQTSLAAQFYLAVRDDENAGSIELTGHSLGGGMAKRTKPDLIDQASN